MVIITVRRRKINKKLFFYLNINCLVNAHAKFIFDSKLQSEVGFFSLLFLFFGSYVTDLSSTNHLESLFFLDSN